MRRHEEATCSSSEGEPLFPVGRRGTRATAGSVRQRASVAGWRLGRSLVSRFLHKQSRHQQLPTFSSFLLGSSMQDPAGAPPVLTARAIAAGLLVGTVLCFSNTYFGLQTGWVTMGSLQSAILGYGLFQALGAAGLLSRHLNAGENVIVQTTAVATATMPLAAGLVGIIPALGLLTPDERPEGPLTFTPWQLLAWCSALAFFGVFVAVPLRYQTVIRERLRFPSGTATASVIRTLHGLPPAADDDAEEEEGAGEARAGGGGSSGGSRLGAAAAPSAAAAAVGTVGPWGGGGGSSSSSKVRASDDDDRQHQRGVAVGGLAGSSSSSKVLSQVDLEVAVWAEGDPEQSSLLGGPAAGGSSSSSTVAQQQQQQQQQWAHALRLLLWSFALSGAYSLLAAFIKPLKVLKVFDWVNLPAATAWGWALQPSAGYIGQGMIMGPKTAWSMMAGAVTGWAILGPLVRAKGWAPGPIKSIETGAAGWLMWLGLALLLGDCFSELGLLITHTLYDKAVANRCWLWLSGSDDGSGSGRGRSGGRQSPFVGLVLGSNKQQPGQQAWGGQQQQQQGGLRSRPGSKGCVSAAAAVGPGVLELSPNSSTGNVADDAAAAAAAAAGQRCSDHTAVAVAPAEEQQQQQGLDDEPGGCQLAGSRQPTTTSAAAASAGDSDDSTADAQAWLLSASFWVPGLLLSTALATAVLSPMLQMPLYEPLVAVFVALLVALLAVRALGQTDLNPVSGVGKISQLVFAVVSPGAVLPNLVAGAIAEAGAQQAGDLMQDFKTAHLLGVAPSSQLVAMLIGSAASVPLSVAAYLLYTSAWQVPGPELPAPTAQIWLDMAKLVNGGHLPDHVAPFCAGAAAIAAALPVLQLLLKRLQRRSHPPAAAGYSPLGLTSSATGKGSLSSRSRSSRVVAAAAARLWGVWRQRTAVDWVLALLPSGVGFAVGCYLTPNWTVPRVLGSILDQTWLLLSPDSHAAFMMVSASGLVLGEGCASVVTAVVQAVLR